MIKITGSQPKQMTVVFGNGSLSVGTANSVTGERKAVVIVDSQAPHVVGSACSLPVVQDRPQTLDNLSGRSVILSYPVDISGVHSINILIEKLIAVQGEICAELRMESEE